MDSLIKSVGFIFDLDGVIVDTAKLHYQAWNRMALSLGFSFTEEQNEALKGVGRMDSLNKILSWGNITLPEEKKLELAVLKNKWYVELIMDITSADALPGAISFLEEVHDKGIHIGLGSASKNALPVLERLGIIDMFDVIVDGHALSKNKPDPEVFLKGASGLDIKPSKCAVFEDAQVGIEAAVTAGMTAIGIGDTSVLKGAEMVFPNLGAIKVYTILELIQQKNIDPIF